MNEKFFYILATAFLTIAVFFSLITINEIIIEISENCGVKFYIIRYLLYTIILYLFGFLFYREAVKLEEIKK
jgi:hypothetical protein